MSRETTQHFFGTPRHLLFVFPFVFLFVFPFVFPFVFDISV